MEIYGYYTPYGYEGLVKGEYILFESESEYIDLVREIERSN